jgi:hypothetical protein
MATITEVVKAAVTPRSPHVATVAQVATVAPGNNVAGTLLLFNNSIRTSKKTQHFSITKIDLLALFK